MSVQQPRGLFYIEMKPELTMVTAFVGQTFEVGTCIFSALCDGSLEFLFGNSVAEKEKQTLFFFCQVIRWKGEMEICTNIAGSTSRHSQHLETLD